MAKISELKDGMKNLIVEGYVTEMSDVREVQARFSDDMFNVKNVMLSETKKPDGKNSITLTLWNEDIERVRMGDKLRVENGYVTSWHGQIQLNIGKFGVLRVV